MVEKEISLHILAPVREQVGPPLVPMLESEADTSYFDDFTNPDDMEIYKEVNHKKQQIEESMRASDTQLPAMAGTEPSGSQADPAPKAADVAHVTAGHQADRAAFIGFTFRHRDFMPARGYY